MVIHDRVNERYYGLVNSIESHEATRARVHWICRSVVGSTVLDVGCSQGIISILLAREGLRVTGIDLEEESIRYAKRELTKESGSVRENVKFLLTDVTEWKTNTLFDTVILGEILEHFANPSILLRQAFRLLKDDGTLVVTVPYGYHPFYDHKQTFYAGNLGASLDPWFEVNQIELQHKYLCCKARKRRVIKEDVLPDTSNLMAWIEFDSKQFKQLEKKYQDTMNYRKAAYDQAMQQLKKQKK
ncbi:MAG: methyltransferase domain-containing protein [Paenibacillaceae bacterium]|uniref:Methyltransferase domain-containing protein n=1 Tax=Paenibacillus mellifer TaxID=2937794 RepID=A0A9X1XX38_9BACL|nr:methyltransferase domain-containing protein [Paenibacillus mellifer]MBW4840281.1 methyltransferase domain-containing protein [Paenibacillaceae bacterium]MCK8486867.1 methyltransferase domain-containing protein [Paenibacillus mellifer]